MKKRIDLSLVLTCYNEESIFEESVDRIIKTLRKSRLSFEIIFVDDKSSDRTAQLVAAVCQEYSFCRAIFHKKNYGRGRSVSDGIEKSRGAVVGYIDIDLEVSSVYIPELVSVILDKKADVVIGKRIYRSGIVSLHRELMSRAYTLLARNLVPTEGLDTETGYKFFNRKKIMPILAKVKNSRWFWDTEVMVLARLAGLVIVEVPVLFIRRMDKRSSVHIVRDSWEYVINLWVLRRQLIKSDQSDQ